MALLKQNWFAGFVADSGQWIVTNGHIMVDSRFAHLDRERITLMAREIPFLGPRIGKGPLKPMPQDSNIPSTWEALAGYLSRKSKTVAPLTATNWIFHADGPRSRAKFSRTLLLIDGSGQPVSLNFDYAAPFLDFSWYQLRAKEIRPEFKPELGPVMAAFPKGTEYPMELHGKAAAIIMPMRMDWGVEGNPLEQLRMAGLIPKDTAEDQ